ncbi:MAG: hypothetical protein OXE94_01825 [Aestuariivita sp.]|nr:hypothetical protein [Aestuariivita sp.]MCY4202804.1 hypothetical protein [Aestuariivita sp.]
MGLVTRAIAAFVRSTITLPELAAVLLLLAATPEAFGQTDGLAAENAGQQGSVPQPSVNLNPITLADQLAWSFQVLLAPKLLEDDIPLYAYSWEGVRNVLGQEDVAETEIDLSWYVGTAIITGEQWTAYPVQAQEMELGQIARILQETGNMVQDLSSLYVVSNIPLARLDIKEKLWIPKEDWLNAVPSGFP